MNDTKKTINEILNCISPRIRNFLNKTDCGDILEIRLRVNRPVVLVNKCGCNFITENGRLTQIINDRVVIAAEYEISDTLNKCCNYSIHTHSKELADGFVTLSCGARIGVCGTAVCENGIVKSVKDITCLNIRIPRNIKGAANKIFEYAFAEGPENLMIIGPPSSGKTTLLKDLVYQISDGRLGKYYKVCVVDERYELSGEDEFAGPNTDIIKGFPKNQAISLALRTMSPDLIVCDEISIEGEAQEIIHAVNCGVAFIVTAHSSEKELPYRTDIKKLVEKGRFSKIVFLAENGVPGKIKKVVKSDEFIENMRNYTDNSVGSICEYQLYKAN